MQKFGELNFVKTRLKFKFGVNPQPPQSFSYELCLYITRFAKYTTLTRTTHQNTEIMLSCLIFGARISDLLSKYGKASSTTW